MSKETEQPERLLTPTQAGELMHVTKGTLLRWGRRGVGPDRLYINHRVIRYRREDIARYMAENAAPVGKPEPKPVLKPKPLPPKLMASLLDKMAK